MCQGHAVGKMNVTFHAVLAGFGMDPMKPGADVLPAGSHQDVAVKPGGVVEVYFDGGEIRHRAIFKAGTDDSSFDTKQHPS